MLSEMSPLSSNWEHSAQKCAAGSDSLNRSFFIPLPVVLGDQSPVPGGFAANTLVCTLRRMEGAQASSPRLKLLPFLASRL